MLSKNLVTKKLGQVLDPELGISIIDLGLIYDVKIKKNDVSLLMTLTFPGCPLYTAIQKEIESKLKELDGIGRINIRITFDPPWEPSKISEKAKEKLGIISY